jgi:hypothetical protein
MTLLDLHNTLQSLGIPENDYYLHGLYGSTDDNDKLALVVKRGKYSLEYEIYYKEKGQKGTPIVFTNESEACQYFLSRKRLSAT